MELCTIVHRKMIKQQLNDLERYRDYQKLFALPTFGSIEDATENMRAVDGKFRRFILRKPLGVYTVCYAFISAPRDCEPGWAYNEEFSFSHADYTRTQQRAALQVGIELIGGPE